MQFDFYGQYKAYTNNQLLDILLHENDYQEDAITAARQVLAEREVNIAEALEALQQPATPAAATIKNTTHFTGQPGSDLLADIQKDIDSPPISTKWHLPFTIVMTIFYALIAIGTFMNLSFYFGCDSCTLELYVILNIISFAWAILILIALYIRKHLAWMLILSHVLTGIISSVISIFSTASRGSIASITPSTYITLLLKGFLIYWMLQPATAAGFNITPKVKKDTVVVSILLCMVYAGALLMV